MCQHLQPCCLKCVIPGSAESVYFGILLEIQIPGCHLRPTKTVSLGVGRRLGESGWHNTSAPPMPQWRGQFLASQLLLAVPVGELTSQSLSYHISNMRIMAMTPEY